MDAPDEQFLKVVEDAVTLRSQDALRLLVEGRSIANVGGVRFVVRRDDARVRSHFDGVEGGYEAFREVLPDLADVINAVIEGVGAERFAAVRSGDSTVFSDAPDVARRKYELVESTMPVAELRERRWVKATSKNPTAGSIDWEVSTKVLDDDTKRPSGAVPYATVRLESGGMAGTLLEFVTGSTEGSTVFTLDAEDVSYYIDTLTRLKEALIRVGSGDQGV